MIWHPTVLLNTPVFKNKHIGLYLALSTGLLLSSTAQSTSLFTSCTGCHGTDGISRSEHIPSIAGLNFQYFYASMRAYKKDQRPNTIMGRIAKGYKSSKLQYMALHFGAKPWTGVQGEFDEILAKRGKNLHDEYCEECHEQNGRFQDRDTPPLAGQAKGYLLYQMIDYRQDSKGLPRPPMMQSRLEKLTDKDLHALAEFYASNPDAANTIANE